MHRPANNEKDDELLVDFVMGYYCYTYTLFWPLSCFLESSKFLEL